MHLKLKYHIQEAISAVLSNIISSCHPIEPFSHSFFQLTLWSQCISDGNIVEIIWACNFNQFSIGWTWFYNGCIWKIIFLVLCWLEVSRVPGLYNMSVGFNRFSSTVVAKSEISRKLTDMIYQNMTKRNTFEEIRIPSNTSKQIPGDFNCFRFWTQNTKTFSHVITSCAPKST